jgi:hypothetical protein
MQSVAASGKRVGFARSPLTGSAETTARGAWTVSGTARGGISVRQRTSLPAAAKRLETRCGSIDAVSILGGRRDVGVDALRHPRAYGGRANRRPTDAARRSTAAWDYNCRNQLTLTMSERAVGMVPFNTACRSL